MSSKYFIGSKSLYSIIASTDLPGMGSQARLAPVRRITTSERDEATDLVFTKLSTRIIAVAVLTARGLSENAVGEVLHISSSTVASHKKRARAILGTENFAQVCLLVTIAGYVQNV